MDEDDHRLKGKRQRLLSGENIFVWSFGDLEDSMRRSGWMVNVGDLHDEWGKFHKVQLQLQ